jgi:hypothetical protein
VPLPKDDAPLPIEEIDTTVREADLVARPAPKQTRLSRSGRQLVALVERGEDHRIMLAVVEDNNGIVASFPLAVADGSTELHGFDGNTYSPVDRWGATGGPIIFAIRVRPTAKAAWQQLVVFAAGRTLRVVTRTLGDTLWRPLLDVQLDAGATFVGIGTTDPH